ncbi:hypothetical protein ABW21_db0201205 [Orbilia brochopaga]|nr:hypothetical protein ABW21_db0201205 [Drechslerella brochopaga]
MSSGSKSHRFNSNNRKYTATSMSDHQQSLIVKKCSGDRIAKREWKPKSSWDHIRGFVESEIRNGRPQKQLLANLQEQNVPIKMHQLKRLLNDWGLSDRNIRQRNRKYIFETEKRLQAKGKIVRGWKFGDTGQRIKDTQLARIRGSEEDEFAEIQASPGVLVPSPADVMVDTPTDSSIRNIEDLHENGVAEDGFYSITPVQDRGRGSFSTNQPNGTGVPHAQDPMDIDCSNLLESTIERSQMPELMSLNDQQPQEPNVETILDALCSDTDEEESGTSSAEDSDQDDEDTDCDWTDYDFESIGQPPDRATVDDEWEGTTYEPSHEEGMMDLPQVVESIGHDASQLVEWLLDAEFIETPRTQTMTVSPEDFVYHMSRKFRLNLHDWIDEVTRNAENFKTAMESGSKIEKILQGMEQHPH